MRIDTEELIIKLFELDMNIDFENDSRGRIKVYIKDLKTGNIKGAIGESLEEALAKIIKKSLSQKETNYKIL